MKYLKVLGVAAFAAMALMAFGAGSASATTLFTDSAKTSDYPAGTAIDASLVAGGSATLTSGSGATIATCTGGTVEGLTSNTTGTYVSGSVETANLTWSGCSQTTVTTAGGTIHIDHTSGNDGTVTGTGFGVTVAIFGVSCTYGAGEGTHLGTLKGGETPVLTIATTVKRIAGSTFLCPATAGWDAEYVVTTPHALYVGA